MKLAVSNIAWSKSEEIEVAQVLQELGVKNIELAPTKQWADPTNVSDAEVEDFKRFWESYGLEVVAFQSMLFARPDLKIFESDTNRRDCQEYLDKFIVLAGKMGARSMVFGSPKNRQRGEVEMEQAQIIAKDFFTHLGTTALSVGVEFCVEPNAPQYACDFITNAQEGINLVSSVDTPGFSLHLDIACMTLAGDDVAASIKAGAKYLKHFHISAPMLGLVEDTPVVDHRAAAVALREIGYDGYVSLEMRPGDEGTNVERVKSAVLFAQEIYG